MRTPAIQPPRSDLRAASSGDVHPQLRAHGAAGRAPVVTTQAPGEPLTDCLGAQRRRGFSSAGESRLELVLACFGIAFALLLATGWPLRWLHQLAEVLQ